MAVQVAVLGYGTVGSGVVEVLTKNKEIADRNSGKDINVKYVLDLREFPGDPVEKILVHDVNVILEDPEVDIVVETMGGLKPAYDFVKSALLKGKSVCTSNKALVEAYGDELIAISKEKSVNFLFEASVGGGIPIIRPLNTCITADDICEISGILNGTTNYMLTKMADCGASYDEVLKEAQDLGYAERNPEADVEGADAGRKIAILSSIVSGKKVSFEALHVEGITKITPADIAFAKKFDAVIKLVATSKKVNGGILAMVSPKMLGKEHPLSFVNGVMNAVFVKGNMLGDAMFYGAGAGKLPTASAVCGDVVDAAKNLGKTMYTGWTNETMNLVDISDVCGAYYVRALGDDGVAKRAADVFHASEIRRLPENPEEFAFISDTMTESEYQKKASEFKILNMIRFEK